MDTYLNYSHEGYAKNNARSIDEDRMLEMFPTTYFSGIEHGFIHKYILHRGITKK